MKRKNAAFLSPLGFVQLPAISLPIIILLPTPLKTPVCVPWVKLFESHVAVIVDVPAQVKSFFRPSDKK